MPRSGLVLRTSIDATRKGNIARFFNHACDGGNLAPVALRRSGQLLPAVALVAARNIEVLEGEAGHARYLVHLSSPYFCPCRWLTPMSPICVLCLQAGQELTFAYGPPNAGPQGSVETGQGTSQQPADEGGDRPSEGMAGPTQGSSGADALAAGKRAAVRRCLCGTSACLGWMPSSNM